MLKKLSRKSPFGFSIDESLPFALQLLDKMSDSCISKKRHVDLHACSVGVISNLLIVTGHDVCNDRLVRPNIVELVGVKFVLFAPLSAMQNSSPFSTLTLPLKIL